MSDAPAEVTFISEAHVVSGSLKGQGDVEIRGIFNGRIEIDGALTVAPQGLVHADVSANRVEIFGEFRCTVLIADQVIIRDGGKVIGDVRAPNFTLAEGGRLKGHLDTASQREDLIDAVLGELSSSSLKLFAEPKWGQHSGGLD